MRDRNMGGYEDFDTSTRVLWSWRKVDGIMLDALWKWDNDEGDGEIKVGAVLSALEFRASPGVARPSATIRSADLARLQHAWDTWHALIDDPATAPDAVLHWLAEVTPARHTDTETQEETTT